jgi:DNA-binding CsgD family transcriptional regulator
MEAITRPQPKVTATLTPRQQEVLGLVAAGRTNPEIAEALGITLAGAKWHVSEVISRLGVTSREEAAEYWREQNRLPSRFARAMRGLLGVGLLKTVAAGAAAATLSGGVVVAVAVFNSDGEGANDGLVVETPAPTATPAPPDPATKDGLTLRIVSTSMDDTETTIDVVLEGRPELGRFASPAFTAGLELRDQQGNVYRQRAMGGSAANTRLLYFTFDPITPSATTLTLTLVDAGFVNPASEVPEGQRPPDPSAIIAGPWVVHITEFAQKASAQVAVDHAPRPFGTASVVIDEIRQAQGATVVWAHLVGFPKEDVPGLRLEWQLIDQNGIAAAILEGRWGEGPEGARIEWRFVRTTGSVTLRLRGHAAPPPPIAEERITSFQPGLTPVPGVIPEEANAVARWRAELAARLEAMFAVAPPAAEWTVTLP